MARIPIIGLDPPTVAPLRTAPDPLPELQRQARLHEIHRLESVAETLALVAVMTVKGVLKGRESVTVGKAVYQFGTGSRAAQTNAAHCLPGQIEFETHPIHQMPYWTESFLRGNGIKAMALDSKLRNLSGRTDAVDHLVNSVDSLLERMDSGRGLKPQFGRAVQQVMHDCSGQKPRTWGGVIEKALSAMEHYRFAAACACGERLDQLIMKSGVPAAASKLESTRRKALVTEQYLLVLEDASVAPGPTSRDGFRVLAKDVLEDGHQLFSRTSDDVR